MKKIKRTLIHFLIVALVISNVALLPVDVLASDYGVGGVIKVVATAAGSGGNDVSQVNLEENWTGLLLNSQLVYDSAKVEISNITYSLIGDYQGSFQILQNGQVSVAKPFNYENPPYGGVEVTVNCQFHYKLGNGYGADVSEQKTVTVNLQNVDEYPVPQNKTYNLDEDSILNIGAPGFLSGVVDPEGDTVTAAISGTCNKGTVNVNSNGSFTYTPNLNYFGADSFVYQIYTNGNPTGKTGTISLNITGLPDPPWAEADTAVCNEDSEMDIDVLLNDYDPDNFNQPTIVDPITVTNVTPSVQSGSTIITAQGKIHYKPKSNYNGADSFTYTISDSSGSTPSAIVNVTVNAVNDLPVAVADTAACDEDSSVEVDVLANDIDIENGPLSLAGVGTPGHGNADIVNGKIKYTPTPNYFGTDSCTYQVSDGTGTSQGTLTVTVKGVQDVPVAVNDSFSCNEDQELDLAVLGNDSDPDNDTIVITSVTPGGLGSVTITADKKKVHYAPKKEYSGADSFAYAISDGYGGTATAAATINVIAVNDPPTAVADTAACDEDSSVEVDVLANDTDAEGEVLSLVGAGTPGHGSAAIVNGKIKYTPVLNYFGPDSCTYQVSDGTNTSQGTLTINVKNIQELPVAVNDSYAIEEDQELDLGVLANDYDVDNDNLIITNVTPSTNAAVTISPDKKMIHYKPKSNYNGADSFAYTISDGQGGTATATVNLTITAVNDSPVAVHDNVECFEDSLPTEFDLLANDFDPDGPTLKFGAAEPPQHGDLYLEYYKYIYTPHPNFFGIENLSYSVMDGAGGHTNGTLAITVKGVQDIPTAANDNAGCDEDMAVWINVLSNDKDLDNDPLTISVTSSPKNGTAAVSGSGITYLPKQNWHGTDNLEYTINDGKGGTAAAIATIIVNDIYDLPVANDDFYSVNINTGLTVSALGVLKNDSGVEGPLTVELVETVKHGMLTLNSDGSFTYRPEDSWVGEDSFTYRSYDGKKYSNTAKGLIDVKKPGSNSGGGGGGGGGGGAASDNQATISTDGKPGTALPVKLDPKSGQAVIDLGEQAQNGLNGNHTVVNVSPIRGANHYVLEISSASLAYTDGNKKITFMTEKGSMTIPGNMLSEITGAKGNKAEISIGTADKNSLPDSVRLAVGEHPLIQMTLKVDGKQMTWNNPKAPITVSIPYKPTATELADPEHITVWYIDGSGNAVSVPSGRYNAKTGKVTFTTTHFSNYAVAYVNKSFEDLNTVSWAKNQIRVLASKGIMNGVSSAAGGSDQIFAPKTNITRADFLYSLIRTLGVDARIDSSFDDISKDRYYYHEMAVAKALGIATGTGNSKFNPEETITRQDMITLSARALEKYKALKKEHNAAVLDKFSDKDSIAEYAVPSIANLVKEGLITGDGSRLNPRGQTTRAEAAVFLYRIYNKY